MVLQFSPGLVLTWKPPAWDQTKQTAKKGNEMKSDLAPCYFSANFGL